MTSETIEKALLTPDFLIKLATELKTEQEKNKKLQMRLSPTKKPRPNITRSGRSDRKEGKK